MRIRRSAPPGLAKFDSASIMVQALARFLHGRDFPALGQPAVLQYPASLLDFLPRKARERLFARIGSSEGVARGKLGEVSAGEIAEWAAGLYPRRRSPAVMIGSSSGALVHLAAAFGVPWLPQTFLTLVDLPGVHPDDATGAMEAGREPAERYLAANPDVDLHHMHDPNQDRLMLGRITYFRSKFRRLPPAYRDFLCRSLDPGGTILVTECALRWPTRRVSDRHVYQFGAVGGLTQDEYFHGSERVEDYLARYGSPRRRWEPPTPDTESPEAEWGFGEPLRDDIEAFAQEHGYRVVRLVFDAPADLSPPVADLYRAWHRERGLPADRLLIDSFIMLEPYWALRTGSVPFWMTFNTEPSLAAAQRYLSGADPFDAIHLTLFPHGTDSAGLPPIEAWRDLVGQARKTGAFLGFDADAYPAHFSAFARYSRALRSLEPRHALPEPLPLACLSHLVGDVGPSRAVRLGT